MFEIYFFTSSFKNFQIKQMTNLIALINTNLISLINKWEYDSIFAQLYHF